MLKVTEIHLAAHPGGEYLVLQNHSLTTLSLRGWAITTDAYYSGSAEARGRETYVFLQDESIKPYTRIVLFTGAGPDEWRPTVDGKQAFVAHWGRAETLWDKTENVHVLNLSSSRKVVIPE